MSKDTVQTKNKKQNKITITKVEEVKPLAMICHHW